MHCDLNDANGLKSGIEAAADRFGSVGAIVVAAGGSIGLPFVSQITEAQWREVIGTEVLGFSRLVSAALPTFRQQKRGNFVVLTTSGTYRYPPGDALSAVPKAAIEMLGRAVAKEEGRYGIRANMVAPGMITAGLGKSFLENFHSPDVWEAARKRVALQRFGSSNEIAEAVAFLASERSSYITGHTLIVDGGAHI